MADKSAIEWTEATWNPVVGCSIVSPGCTNCYAMKMAARLEAMGQPIYQGMTQPSKAGAVWSGKVEQSNWGQVIKPLSWKRPRMIFVNSMSDLFHESVPDETIDTVFTIMALAPQHTYQVLTKRADRMRSYVTALHKGQRKLNDTAVHKMGEGLGAVLLINQAIQNGFPSVWLGVSAEDQKRADERIPLLLDTPAAVRWVSAEPLLGPIDFRKHMWPVHRSWPAKYRSPEEASAAGETVTLRRQCLVSADARFLDWIVVGGESGPGARSMHPDWARSIRDQCAAAGVPFFFKQWGAWKPETRPGTQVDIDKLLPNQAAAWGDGETNHVVLTNVGKSRAGRLLDGQVHDAMPAARS